MLKLSVHPSQSLTIRGFSARGDIFLDGMRDFGSYYRDPFYLDDVQVLKGPSSILFGRGSTGGVVEQDSKQAQLAPVTAGTVSFGTDLTKRVTADLDRALPELAETAALRLNVMGQNGGVAGRDVTQNTRGGIAPTLALGLGTPTRLTLSYLHQSEYDIPDYGVPLLYEATAGTPSAIAHPVPLSSGIDNNFYGFAHGDYLRTNVDTPTAKIEHDVNDNVTLRDQFRYGYYQRQFRITEPQIGDNAAGPTPSPGLIAPGTALFALAVTRNELSGKSIETSLENQSDVTARFKTGFIDHTAVAGVELGRETSDPTRYTTITPFSSTPLLSPTPDQAFNATLYTASATDVTANTQAAYALDTLKFNEQWQVMLGGRYDRFDASFSQNNYNNPNTGAGASVVSLNHVDNMPSWRGAVIYKPTLNGTIYVDGGTSFDPSAEQLSLTAANA